MNRGVTHGRMGPARVTLGWATLGWATLGWAVLRRVIPGRVTSRWMTTRGMTTRGIDLGLVALGCTAVGGLLPIAASAAEDTALGVGVVNPPIDPERPLYFYLSADLNQYPPMATPSDSVTFRSGPHSIEIATAPPWFVPETLKLDYDLLYLRAVSISRYWIEVVVNDAPERPRSFPRTVWVARDAVQFRTWTEFLLEVFCVETLEPSTNPVRSGPGEAFPQVGSSENLNLHVVAIQGSWARVEDVDGTEASTLRGWIRWRDGDRLIVTYSLLS